MLATVVQGASRHMWRRHVRTFALPKENTKSIRKIFRGYISVRSSVVARKRYVCVVLGRGSKTTCERRALGNAML